MPKARKTLGEFLVENKIISTNQLQTARLESEKTDEALSHVVVRLGMASEDSVLKYYTEFCKMPQADLKNIDPQILSLIPETFARRYHLIPIVRKEKKLVIAMSDPLNVIVKDEIKFKTGLEVEAQAAPNSEITQAISQLYKTTGSLGEILEKIDLKSVAVAEEESDPSKLQSLAEEAPVIKLVNSFIASAFHDRASDLHIEPDENILRIRQRVDGILYDIATMPKHLQPAIISRAKIMSDLNIAVKRAPQDGRFQIEIEGNPIDVRVSTYPTIYGENVVMRLLDSRAVLFGVEEVGFSSEDNKRFKKLLATPYGIILVTGPTGSGKTTTLYSALNTLNSPKKNIMTIEDPVEYHLFGIRQAQVNPQGGLTFATGLRSILRQDPDIIMVGEIRDLETAEIAVHSALTGHLVLSTLHTNDATSALTRLIDMGVEPFLVSSSVVGILAQRLVRKLCDECKEPFTPNPQVLEEIGLSHEKKAQTFYKGKGCKKCKDGFRGRIGIFELLVMTEQIKEMVLSKAPLSTIKATAKEAGMKTLRENGIEKVLQGVTSIDEILEVTRME
ncbi:MAG: type II secretion system ATPase GspE [Candidatus Margulisbacteria bacterium]|nr:type II secretion system ATPase GspE [Candidatus Margulisiibacteriota bacterium]